MELIPESKKSIFSAKDCTLFIAPLVIIETQCEEVMYRTRYLKKSLTKNPSGSEELGDSLALSDQYTCRQDCGDSGLDEPAPPHHPHLDLQGGQHGGAEVLEDAPRQGHRDR